MLCHKILPPLSQLLISEKFIPAKKEACFKMVPPPHPTPWEVINDRPSESKDRALIGKQHNPTNPSFVFSYDFVDHDLDELPILMTK